MEKFENKRWRDICAEDKEMLLKNAVCRDGLVGSPLTEGFGLVHFSETLTAMGIIHDGVISIEDDELLYNPCIGKNGETMCQEELNDLFDEYAEKETENTPLN